MHDRPQGLDHRDAARDGGLDQLRARRDALGESAVAEAELPDPQLRFGALNVPTDSFDLDQEPMTQVQIGLRQQFGYILLTEDGPGQALGRPRQLQLRGGVVEQVIVPGTCPIYSGLCILL